MAVVPTHPPTPQTHAQSLHSHGQSPSRPPGRPVGQAAGGLQTCAQSPIHTDNPPPPARPPRWAGRGRLTDIDSQPTLQKNTPSQDEPNPYCEGVIHGKNATPPRKFAGMHRISHALCNPLTPAQ